MFWEMLLEEKTAMLLKMDSMTLRVFCELCPGTQIGDHAIIRGRQSCTRTCLRIVTRTSIVGLLPQITL
jgi:hypothetical protein